MSFTSRFQIRFVTSSCVAAVSAGGLRLAGQVPPPTPPLAPDAPFTVAVATAVVEAGPVYMAKEGPYGSQFNYINGGVRTLTNDGAHAAGNATTQMLVVLRDNPKVRLLFTLVDGNYRIVAKRSAGISKLADLKGKRVVTPRTTSAHYHLVAMLRSAGLQESDVTMVSAPATRWPPRWRRARPTRSRCGSRSRRTPWSRSATTRSSSRTTRCIASCTACTRRPTC